MKHGILGGFVKLVFANAAFAIALYNRPARFAEIEKGLLPE